MRIVRDDLWLCDDCLFMAVNGDGPESETDAQACEAGLTELGPHLVPDFDSEAGEGIREHAIGRCDCCKSRLHGQRHRFAVLGD